MVDTDAIVVGKMLEQAYRKAGALKHPGQGISASESAEAMLICNMMINGWKIERLLIVYVQRKLVSFFAGQQNYSVGPGQDFDVERVEKIPAAGYILNPGETTESEIPMMVVLTYEQYERIIAKLTGSNQPLIMYYKALVEAIPGNVPYGQATLWPVPNADGTMAIYIPRTLDGFDDPSQIAYMPKGYQEMFVYNLAIRIHENYPEKKWDERRVETAAAFYKDRVKNMQLTPILAFSDSAALAGTSHPYWYGYPKTWTPYGS